MDNEDVILQVENTPMFAHYRVGTPRVTTPKALSMSDFIKIRDVELPEDKPILSVSLDLFLFACYAGTAFIGLVTYMRGQKQSDEILFEREFLKTPIADKLNFY